MGVATHMEKKLHRISILRPGLSTRKFAFMAGFLMMALANSCVDPYNPKATQTDVSYLTVDGILNGPGGITNLYLSRTATLATSSLTKPETNASVQIESFSGSKFILVENTPGTYSAASLPVDASNTYRVTITTSAHKNYASDFVAFKDAPPIDSVNWTADDQNLHVYVNAHDEGGTTLYYLWNWAATWSYHTPWRSTVKYEDGQIIKRDLNDDIYHCWKTVHSTRVLVGSTAHLTSDVISNHEIITEPLTSEKLQTEYSVLVEQFALTEAAYNYWQELKKNTENLGTLFGPQPSTLASNLHCLTTPDEPVLGYFSAGSSTQQRIIIMSDELPPAHHITGYEDCVADTLFLDQVPFFTGAEFLISEAYKGPGWVGYLMSSQDCVDCTYHGGTTVKPDYWK